MATRVLRNAQYLATDFLVELETWQVNHQKAMCSRDLEDDLELLNAALKVVSRWLSSLASTPLPERDAQGAAAIAKRSADAAGRLLAMTRKVAEYLWSLEQSFGCKVDGFLEFEALRARIDSDVGKVRRLVELGFYRPNPRPVQIAEDGQLIEMDGTPINMEAVGLNQEAIREDMLHPEAIHFQPLKDVIAGRA